MLLELHLFGCGIERLPANLGSMKALQHLGLYSLRRLKALPSSLVFLTALEQLDVAGCNLLQWLPVNGWEQMMSLKKICFSDCTSLLSLPMGLCKIPHLNNLVVDNCDSLQVVPEQVMQLRSLQLS